MSTPVLNNGIFLRDTRYEMGSHVDSYHLSQMMKDNKPMDLGPVDMWAMSQKVEMPLYQFSSFSGKNVIEVDNVRGEYTWQTPVSQDLPYIIEDVDPSNTTKGIDGQPFQIKLSRRFGHGEVITYDKYSGVELIVTNDDILPLGNGYLITVKLVNNDNAKFLDNQFLANSTQYYSVSTMRSPEYGGRYSDIEASAGFREYYNFVGQVDAHTHYSVSNQVALMAANGANMGEGIPVTEIWRNWDPNLDPALTNLDQIYAKMGGSYIKKAMSNGTLQRSFLTALDAVHLRKIGHDLETYLMWGKGGRVSQQGADDIRASVGLWKQLDSAFKYVFNKANFSLDIFRNQLYNFFAGREEFKTADPSRILEVQTGMAGMRMVNELIGKQATGAGFVIQAAANNGIGAITGSSMNLSFGYFYQEFIIPFFARLRFKINPAFDNIQNNPIENPLIDGYPLSSYSFIIFDVTDNTNDNIFLLKKKWNNQLKWFYENGDMDFMGRTSGFQGDHTKSGFRCFMSQPHMAVWVKDPTKVLKVVMRNPITGGSL